MLAYRDRVPETCYLAYCDCSRIETMPVTGAFASSLSRWVFGSPTRN